MGTCYSSVSAIVSLYSKSQNEMAQNEMAQNEMAQNKETEINHEGNQRNMSNHYIVNYPAHEPRKNSAIYTKTHNSMKHMPCFICNKNEPHMETHHFYCEKAAQNAINWDTFGEFAKTCYNIQTGENIGHFDWVEVTKNPDIFVDSPSNMIVLCKKHHTSGNKGIHHVPFPEWILQKYPKNGFEFLK